jgi:RNA polymerase sigma factor (sigma-70 family)
LVLYPVEDSRLRERCLNQDDSAWRELYRRSFSIARSIALAPPFRFDPGTADDIAQGVVVELTNQLPDVQNWIGFTGRVAHNKCVDRVRKRKEIPISVLATTEQEEQNLVGNLPGVEFLPETLDDAQTLTFVRSALAELGQPCQDLLRARFFDELSYADVAIRVPVPAEQVGVYIGRCLGRLRKRIEEQPGVWEELRAMISAGG